MIIKNIEYDGYTIREKETLKEYILSDKTEKVVLEENEITSIIFENVKKLISN